MATVSLKSLFNKLNQVCQETLAAAPPAGPLAAKLLAKVRDLEKTPADRIVKELRTVVEGTAEDEVATAGADGGAATPGAPVAGSKTPSLDQFTMNLTERAKK